MCLFVCVLIGGDRENNIIIIRSDIDNFGEGHESAIIQIALNYYFNRLEQNVLSSIYSMLSLQ